MHVRVHVYAWWVVYRLLLCGNPFGISFSLREKKTFQHNAWHSTPLMSPWSDCIFFVCLVQMSVRIFIPEKASFLFISIETISECKYCPLLYEQRNQGWFLNVCIKPFYFITNSNECVNTKYLYWRTVLSCIFSYKTNRLQCLLSALLVWIDFTYLM